VRRQEPKRAIGLPFDLITLLVDRAMMVSTQHREVRERRRPAVRPVANMVALAEADAAPRKAPAAVTMV
jgi:hypothetical protein